MALRGLKRGRPIIKCNAPDLPLSKVPPLQNTSTGRKSYPLGKMLNGYSFGALLRFVYIYERTGTNLRNRLIDISKP